MAILVTWNPKYPDYSWEKMSKDSQKTLAGEHHWDWWSIGKSGENVAKLNSRVFLLRQVVEPRGIVGSGWVRSPLRFETVAGKKVRAVDIEFDLILNPDLFQPLDWRKFPSGPLRKVHWKTQSSGIRVPDELEIYWNEHVKALLGAIAGDSIDGVTDQDFPEGKISYRMHRSRERNAALIEKAKILAKKRNNGRLLCDVCGFDFVAKYGKIGEGFIEAHHTIPISELPEHGRTKVEEIALVCSNCHRMLHRKRPWLTMKNLTALLGASSPNTG